LARRELRGRIFQKQSIRGCYSNCYHSYASSGRLRNRRVDARPGVPRPQAGRLSGVFVAGCATATEGTASAGQLSGSGGEHRDFKKLGAGGGALAGAEKTAGGEQGKRDGDAALYRADPVAEGCYSPGACAQAAHMNRTLLL